MNSKLKDFNHGFILMLSPHTLPLRAEEVPLVKRRAVTGSYPHVQEPNGRRASPLPQTLSQRMERRAGNNTLTNACYRLVFSTWLPYLSLSWTRVKITQKTRWFICYSHFLFQNELLGAKIEDIRSNNDDSTKGLSRTPHKRRLFHYQSPSREPEDHGYSLSPVSRKSQKLLTSPKKSLRKIPRAPYKVLDAPDLQDDFYLNLVDWSYSNVLTVGLGSSVYLWSASTSQVTLFISEDRLLKSLLELKAVIFKYFSSLFQT